MRPARHLVAAAAAVCLFAAFSALGTWQVQRRAWKLALIERVEQRVHAPPSAAPASGAWPQVTAAADEYRHVQVTGRFLADADTLVQASTELGAGFWVMTPLQQRDGSVVLVNRGFVPPDRHDRENPPKGLVTVTGLLRLSEPGGGFLRRNDAAHAHWYSRDVAAIAEARGLPAVAPYFIDAEAGPPNEAAPVGGLTVISFHNSHLAYALTWYTLALMAGWAAWRVLRHARDDDDSGDEGASHQHDHPH